MLETSLLTQQVSAGTVDFDWIVTFLLVDVEDKTIRTEVLPQLPLDVALQVLVALLLVRQVVAHVVIGRTLVLHRGLRGSSLLHKFIPQSLTQKDVREMINQALSYQQYVSFGISGLGKDILFLVSILRGRLLPGWGCELLIFVIIVVVVVIVVFIVVVVVVVNLERNCK